jgi:hypothetical protein
MQQSRPAHLAVTRSSLLTPLRRGVCIRASFQLSGGLWEERRARPPAGDGASGAVQGSTPPDL